MVTLFGGYSYDGVSAGVWLLLCYASDVKGSRFQVLDCAGEYIKSAWITFCWVLLNENSWRYCHVWLFAFTNLITYESVYSSPSLPNEYLWYDKLWGPSQRVVTLFQIHPMKIYLTQMTFRFYPICVFQPTCCVPELLCHNEILLHVVQSLK